MIDLPPILPILAIAFTAAAIGDLIIGAVIVAIVARRKRPQ